MRLFLSGPMTGIEDYNRQEFDRVAGILRGMGHKVFNPAEAKEIQGKVNRRGYRVLLSLGLEWMCLKAEGLVVLRGYHNSRGCVAEIATARAIKIHIWREPDLPPEAK